ncbi:MAG: NADPH-dependent FMN reductase [Caulobacteraceae bacterium]
MLRILSICGSLRADSINARALAAAEALAPEGARFVRYAGLGQLPHFNPDLEQVGLPDLVRAFREEVGKADGIVICAPEYAHGMPGALKNAMDWLVGGGEMAGKPVAVINISARAVHAHEQILEVLRMIAAEVGDRSSIVIPLQSGAAALPDLLADLEFSQILSTRMRSFINEIR